MSYHKGKPDGWRKPLRERFDEGAGFSGVSSCRPWRKATSHSGYGVIGAAEANPKQLKAHRVAWELNRGPIPEGLFVLHRCDNPPCVNPWHLFLGTSQDNMDDMTKKGRQTRGEKTNTAKLTHSEVRLIRASSDRGAVLARRFGVSKWTVYAVLNRVTWKHVL